MPRPHKPASPFRYFNSSPELIRLVVMMHVRFPLSLRNVEDLLFERDIDLCHETVRHWWNRFGPCRNWPATARLLRLHPTGRASAGRRAADRRAPSPAARRDFAGQPLPMGAQFAGRHVLQRWQFGFQFHQAGATISDARLSPLPPATAPDEIIVGAGGARSGTAAT